MKKETVYSMKCLIISRKRYNRFLIRDVVINAGLTGDNIFEAASLSEISSKEINFNFKAIIIDHDDNFDFSYMEELSNDELFCNVPVIIITSKASKKLVLTAIELGVSGIILRPLKIANMKKNLDKAFELSNKQQSQNLSETT